MADQGSRTAAVITAVATLVTAVAGAIVLIIVNLPKSSPVGGDASPSPPVQPTAVAVGRAFADWIEDSDGVCRAHLPSVSAAGAVVTANPQIDAVRSYTTEVYEFFDDLLAVSVPEPGGDLARAERMRDQMKTAREAIVRYTQAFEQDWPLLLTGALTPQELSAHTDPPWKDFVAASMRALSDLESSGAPACDGS